MKIEHIAIWVSDLEKTRDFYVNYFGGTSNELYYNPKKNFSSYFISFDEGCRLELMYRPDITNTMNGEGLGITHFAISVYSKSKVDELTEKLRTDGYAIAGEPRTTGDGYYESVILDPEGNRVEITA